MSLFRRTFLSLFALAFAGCAVGTEGGGDRAESGGDGVPGVTLRGTELSRELERSPVREAPVAFRRLAFSWTGEAPDGFEVATSRDGRRWSRWRPPTRVYAEVEDEVYQLGEMRARGGKARYYRLRGTDRRRPTRIRVEFLERALAEEAALGSEGAGQTRAALGRRSRALTIGGVSIRSRSSWGARSPRCSGGSDTPRRITLHHTDTPNEGGSPEAQLRQIQRYHQDTRGWCDIGYHFIISRDGVIWLGRPPEELGAHVLGANSGNLGIALLGNFEAGKPSERQIESAARLIDALGSRYDIPLADSTLSGHRDFRATACPGESLYRDIPEVLALARGGAPPEPDGDPEGDRPLVVGFVYDAADPGDRIAGASVAVGSQTTTTDESGRYRVELPPGDYQVRAEAPGYLPTTLARSVSGSVTWASVGLSRAGDAGGAQVQGIVHRAGDSNRRLGGVVVRGGGVATETDERGYYRLSGLAAGEVMLTAGAEGYRTAERTVEAAEGEVRWANFALSAGESDGAPDPDQVGPSCAGRCGDRERVPGSSPECHCDASCAVFDDCCDDYEAVCGGGEVPAASCAGRCGSSDPVPGSDPPCYCDAGCAARGDCCGDRAEVCPDPRGASCQGRCGDSTMQTDGSGEACHCDPSCAIFGDCCEDYAAACSASCSGHCGTSEPVSVPDGRICRCDPYCDVYGDCCDDYASLCPTSCSGNCGSSEPVALADGRLCYCDDACEENGDCCGDYAASCR